MKLGVISLGCVKNRVDTEEMLSFLQRDGFQFVQEPKEAEVLVVNTCGFIESAKEESIDTILEMAQFKETGQCRILCVTGCLAQRYGEELTRQIPEIDVLSGVSQYPALGAFIREALTGKKAGSTLRGKDFSGCGRVLTTAPYSAYVKIAEGCDNRCAYCAIPLIRGGFRSKPRELILAEMRQLAERGATEQILISQDTSRYGHDLPGESLERLLNEASQIPGITFLRALYLYPDELSQKLMKTMASLPTFCRYLDLPLQHAAPKILKSMRRRGDIGEIASLLEEARGLGFALRTTMIVGFPGESEADFLTLMDFCAKLRFDRLGAFAFSPEEDTPAFDMPGQVPEHIKQERLNALMAQQQGISLQRNQSRIGQFDKALIVGHRGRLALGRTAYEAPDSDGLVMISGKQKLAEGNYVDIRITGATAYDLSAQHLEVDA